MRSKLLVVLFLFVALATPTSAPAAPGVDDDGFAFSLHATGDFAGNFEPCG